MQPVRSQTLYSAYRELARAGYATTSSRLKIAVHSVLYFLEDWFLTPTHLRSFNWPSSCRIYWLFRTNNCKEALDQLWLVRHFLTHALVRARDCSALRRAYLVIPRSPASSISEWLPPLLIQRLICARYCSALWGGEVSTLPFSQAMSKQLQNLIITTCTMRPAMTIRTAMISKCTYKRSIQSEHGQGSK